MRVISGHSKGRKLHTIKGVSIRPTADRVKEAIFNTLAAKIPDCVFLDAFAGTGNVGIEALSRGAQHCTFIEESPRAFALIKKNLDLLGVAEDALVIKGDTRIIIDKLQKKYDIIFLDPPYQRDMVFPIMKKMKHLLKEEGIIVVEAESKTKLKETIDGFRLKKSVKYGDTQVGYYEIM